MKQDGRWNLTRARIRALGFGRGIRAAPSMPMMPGSETLPVKRPEGLVAHKGREVRGLTPREWESGSGRRRGPKYAAQTAVFFLLFVFTNCFTRLNCCLEVR